MKNRAKVLLALFMGVCVFSMSGMDTEASVMDSEMSCAGISVVWSDYLEDTSDSTDATLMSFESTVVGETAPTLSNDTTETVQTTDVTAADTTQAAPAEDTTTEETKQEESEYDDIAIAQVTNYVNLRSEANTESEVVGKLYNNSAATILAIEGDWYKIKSGTVDGYVKSEFVVSGDEAAKLAETVGTRKATVDTVTLKVRENPSLDSTILTLVAGGDDYEVLEEKDGWAKIIVDQDMEGYVSSDYVTTKTEFVQAESIEEEQARLAKEEEERLAAEEAARQADAEDNNTVASTTNNTAATNNTSTSTNNTSNNTSSNAETSQKKDTSSSEKSSKNDSSSKIDTSNESSATGIREKIVNYALKFVGNPYVYGGTSLTNGADCSGFVQSVFRDCGISIPRDSRSQAAGGTTISVSDVKPGDLLFYSKGGRINHVALYIGNGKVVHASTPKTGIKISSYNYRTPCKAVRYVK